MRFGDLAILANEKMRFGDLVILANEKMRFGDLVILANEKMRFGDLVILANENWPPVARRVTLRATGPGDGEDLPRRGFTSRGKIDLPCAGKRVAPKSRTNVLGPAARAVAHMLSSWLHLLASR
jgi:hypothetical protein